MKRALSFDDVLLVPQYSTIKSRSEVSLEVSVNKLGSVNIPIISSPMDTVTEDKMALAMSATGGLGIVHRYNTIEEQVGIIKRVLEKNPTANVGAAVGITGDYMERAHALVEAGCQLLCLDVAHGHHIMMKSALKRLSFECPDAHLMAGNVATLEGFNALADWGAHSVRVSVGGGSICSTRIQAASGVPTFQAVVDCAASDRDCLIIADGGIKNSGDMCKALAAGADLVMVGSLLSGTDEAPGDVIDYGDGTPRRKIYRGMASREAQSSWRGRVSSVEGIATTVPLKGGAKNVVRDLAWGIKSGMSYSGCRTLTEFRLKARFIEQTSASQLESSTHILGTH